MTEECTHNFILVTKSSYHAVPYRLCSKCGAIEELGDLTQAALERAINDADFSFDMKDALAYGFYATFGEKCAQPDAWFMLKDGHPSE